MRPDIAVVAERRRDIEAPAGCSVWVGEEANKNKGLAVLSFGDYRVTRHPAYDPAIRWAAPILVTGPQRFFLLAIWTKRPYQQHLWAALARYRRLLTAGPAVVAGDFNVTSRSMFRMRDGTPAPWHDFTRQMDAEFFLQDLRLLSAYHKYFGEAPGGEMQNTLYFQYKENKRLIYHMDFCFIPESWSARLKSVAVGTYAKWVAPDSRFSDHVPLIVDISLA